jgi:rubrerythrin
MNNYCPIPGASQPKEPMRLIDVVPILKNIELDIMMLHGKADELGESAYAIQCTKDIVKLRYFAKWLKSIPTIDPESLRPTARWKHGGIDGNSYTVNWICRKCGKVADFDYKYCPNCGARMEGRRDE